jgi:uncharacterized peroxidase-related enzyme
LPENKSGNLRRIVMPLFAKVHPQDATGEVAEVFEEIQRTLNAPFIPNFFQTLGKNAPNVLRGTWEVYKNVNWKGMLDPALKELVFTAISNWKNCTYCETAHLAFCAALEVEPANLRAVITDIGTIHGETARAVVKFGLDCARNPHSIDEKRRDELKKHGLSDGEVLELIAMVSFSLYAINLAEAMKLDIDDDFIQILRHRFPEWEPSSETISS